MASSHSIHFRGLSTVLQAYRDREVEAWSLWQSKQFLTKGMTGEELETFLNHLVQSGTTAVYTLKVYEDITDPKQIKERTEADGSFNFRLADPGNEYTPTVSGMQRFVPSQLEQRLAEQDEKMNLILAKLEADEDEADEDEPGILGALTNLLSEPEKLSQLVDIGRRLFGGGAASSQPAMIGNVNRIEESTNNYEEVRKAPTREEKLQRLGVAIDVLEQHDPLLIEHLEKLSKMAAGKPDQFKTLIGMLDVL